MSSFGMAGYERVVMLTFAGDDPASEQEGALNNDGGKPATAAARSRTATGNRPTRHQDSAELRGAQLPGPGPDDKYVTPSGRHSMGRDREDTTGATAAAAAATTTTTIGFLGSQGLYLHT